MGRPWMVPGSEGTLPPFRCPPFASYIPGRLPEWMAHDNVHQARAGLLHAAGEVWKYDGSWRLLERQDGVRR